MGCRFSRRTALDKSLGRILRRLASIYIFTEIKPNVFAHNRISSVYDTGKSVQDILQKYGLLTR